MDPIWMFLFGVLLAVACVGIMWVAGVWKP